MPVAQQAVEVGVVLPLAVAAGSLGCTSALWTLSLLLEKVPEARAQVAQDPTAIDVLAQQLSIGGGLAQREATVSVFRHFVEVRREQYWDYRPSEPPLPLTSFSALSAFCPRPLCLCFANWKMRRVQSERASLRAVAPPSFTTLSVFCPSARPRSSVFRHFVEGCRVRSEQACPCPSLLHRRVCILPQCEAAVSMFRHFLEVRRVQSQRASLPLPLPLFSPCLYSAQRDATVVRLSPFCRGAACRGHSQRACPSLLPLPFHCTGILPSARPPTTQAITEQWGDWGVVGPGGLADDGPSPLQRKLAGGLQTQLGEQAAHFAHRVVGVVAQHSPRCWPRLSRPLIPQPQAPPERGC